MDRNMAYILLEKGRKNITMAIIPRQLELFLFQKPHVLFKTITKTPLASRKTFNTYINGLQYLWLQMTDDDFLFYNLKYDPLNNSYICHHRS